MFKFLYKKILKPIMFRIPADDVHDFFISFGGFLGRYSFCRKIFGLIFGYKNKILNQDVCGINFENPIGLSAGFDYDAKLIEILPSVGFGFETVGTVTALPYGGNQKPMLGRLPKSKSLLVNKGFKNEGVDKILKRVWKVVASSATRRGGGKQIPLGISIGSTNKAFENLGELISDIYTSFSKTVATDFFDYYELNISCPNLTNLENIKEGVDTPSGLDYLLGRLNTLGIKNPLFIKMHLEKSVAETLILVEVANKYSFVSGFIFSNLAKKRDNEAFDKEEIEKAGKGNFSGKPTEKLSNILISEVCKKYKDRFVIIGCGGIFTAEDAYEKIKRGATLVQMITGMIYEGPSVVSDINKGLAELLRKDGYKNISEVVGTHKDCF